MKYIYLIILVAIFAITNSSFANNYHTNNGYEVELYWKVRHKRTLIIWGSVQEGRSCKRLKLNVGMKHNENRYMNLKKTFNVPHTYNSRSAYKIEKEYNSKNLPDKGWYPDYISVQCSNFN